jgi:hypothetical protein
VIPARFAPDDALDAQASVIADAKKRWLAACTDGSTPARVQALYDTYRRLVIAQVATVAAPEVAPGG